MTVSGIICPFCHPTRMARWTHKIAGLAAIAILTLSSSLPVSAQNTSAQEAKKARLEQEIAVINKQLKDNATRSSSALSSLTLVRKKISNRKELVAETDKKISTLNQAIADKQKQVNVIQDRLDTLSFYYSRLVRSAYKNRDSKIWYMYILSSESLGQAFRRYGYLRDLSSQMNIQARKIKETKAQLENETAQLQQMKKEAEKVRAQRVDEVNSLQSEEADSQKLVTQLKRNKSQYQKELSTKQNQVNALNREIARIIREAIEASQAASREASQAKSGTVAKGSGMSKGSSKGSVPTTVRKPSQPIDYKLADEFSANKGKLPWPADGPVVDPFGQHVHPVFTKVMMPFNNGVTIAVSPGTKVKAVFDGVVKQIVVMPGYNQCVLIQHGSYFTFYCKLKSVYVKSGDKVKTEEVIGVVDTINGDTQLHFQLWSGRDPQNPENWLRPQ